jgi:cell division protein FtsI/penicillin-binding protein 2
MNTLVVLTLGAFAALAARLVDLQVVRHDEFLNLAANNTVRSWARVPMRGGIYDVHGNPLATSIPAKVICADPTLIGDQRMAVARALAPLLQTNVPYLLERLTPRPIAPDKTNLSQYAVLKHKVTLETWEQIQQTMASLYFGLDETKLKSKSKAKGFYDNLHARAIFAEADQIRNYPGQDLGAHVVGYVSGEGTNQTGMYGIESEFNSKLTGVPGWRHTELDSRRRELVVYRDEDIAPRDGLNVTLTLDAGLQNIMESELAAGMHTLSPISISSVMIRPRTGEILAMANVPTFDPNHPGSFPPDALRNRMIADMHEPGSTFKVVVVSAALNEHLVNLTDIFNCEHGHFAYAGATLHDHESYGDLTVQGIITKSSNIGAAKIGMRLGEDGLYQYIREFGFGSRTGIFLPGEVFGSVPPVKSWSKLSIARIPMGQGIAVTPLQMAMAVSTIANRGLLMRPMIVDHLSDADGKVVVKYSPQPVRQVAGRPAMEQMIAALKTVVTKDGTAPKARLDHYTVAGKTGTAEKVENGHYVSDKYFSSFIGFFPADNPELCIGVFIDEPPRGDHFGGAAAGPIFKAIAERSASYLNLKPDIDTNTPPATLAAALPSPGRAAHNP